jgi:hypothetical protein
MIIVMFSILCFVLYEVNFCFAVDRKLLKLTVVVRLIVTFHMCPLKFTILSVMQKMELRANMNLQVSLCNCPLCLLSSMHTRNIQLLNIPAVHFCHFTI